MANWAVTYTFANGTVADATQVNSNTTDLINCSSDGTKDMSIAALTLAGALTANGNVTLGNASGDDVTITGSIAASVAMKTAWAVDFGSAAIGVKSLYLGSNDAAAYSVRLIGGAMAASYTITFPTAVPAGNEYALEATTGGVASWVNRRKPPTVQKFTSGSGTYTTPSGVTFILVRIVGGGGGGGGGGTSGGTASAGGNSTFGTSLLTANGGNGGACGTTTVATGGSATMNSPAIGTAITGTSGCLGNQFTATYSEAGAGGNSFFGGGGNGANGPQTGGTGIANTGSGGGGGSASVANSGNGGGSGAYIEAIIPSASGTYSYAVGASGAGGSAGTSGGAGGAGAAGYIEVVEYYQ